MISDYEHHNEEAIAVWWAEEGRHADEPRVEDPELGWDDDPFDDEEEEEDA